MPVPDYDAAIAYALQRLHAELPPSFSYHNAWHTAHDVLPAVRILAQRSGLFDAETRLLEVAAAYHDTGFLITQIEHERASCKIAAQVLPQYGFDSAQITRIEGMIMATRLPQSPQDAVEALLSDADLDVLGRDDFLLRNRALRDELATFGRTFTDFEWYAAQLRFL